MPLDFPNSPSVNDTYSAGGRNWTWNGTSWVLNTYVGVVPPGSVDTVQLANSAVTSTKVASGVAAANLGFTPASTGKSIAMAIVFGG